MGEEYLGRVRGIEYFAALALLLELDRPFSPFYWTNVADPELPFVGLIEHANFLDPARYGGRRFFYVANYLPHGHELLSLDAGRRCSPATSPGCARSTRRSRATGSRARGASPSRPRSRSSRPATRGGSRRCAPPPPGSSSRTRTQVYPEDRGTNYAVRLGGEAAAAVAAGT